MVEGTIGKWLKQPGDQVRRYEPLVEVVTDKVTMEVPSPVSGSLLKPATSSPLVTTNMVEGP
ncbi:biotin/lipoyl-containing protein [uncultured Sulfitobacter sp.]|uniref:biotin/lipoyl-containing protein n=1 Tax=uncultured Sulfitobacter sp. TaxID=191468 RepID=UPI00338FFC27